MATTFNGFGKDGQMMAPNAAAASISMLYVFVAMIFGVILKKTKLSGWKELALAIVFIGANSFGGGFGNPNFGAQNYLIVGTITLVACLAWNLKAHSFYKQLSVLFGLVVGYIAAYCFGMVDLSRLTEVPLISLPGIMPISLEFHGDAIFSFFLIFLVSATETLGDTSALAMMGYGRQATSREVSGSIAVDGFVSSLSSLFGCMPITSFSQNVGLVAMTKVVNRKAIGCGAALMILAGIIRFGLVAIKGIGWGVINGLVAERERNGLFADFEDFCRRMSGKDMNKRTVENLIRAGAFDTRPAES